MALDTIVVAIIVGMVAGGLAGLVMKGGSFGVLYDILLGIGGGVAGGLLFRTLGFAPGGGWLSMVAAAFMGAIILIGVQRLAPVVRA